MNFFRLGFWSITISWAMGTIFPSPPHLDCKETLVFWLLIAPSNSLYCTFTCLLILMYIIGILFWQISTSLKDSTALAFITQRSLVFLVFWTTHTHIFPLFYFHFIKRSYSLKTLYNFYKFYYLCSKMMISKVDFIFHIHKKGKIFHNT